MYDLTSFDKTFCVWNIVTTIEKTAAKEPFPFRKGTRVRVRKDAWKWWDRNISDWPKDSPESTGRRELLLKLSKEVGKIIFVSPRPAWRSDEKRGIDVKFPSESKDIRLFPPMLDIV